MLASSATATKKGGQELIGGLDVKVQRNRYGTQIQSFVADLDLSKILSQDSERGSEKPFRGVFIRAPVVEELDNGKGVEVVGVYKGAEAEKEDIVAVKQNNVFGTSFHPELTEDVRIHVWWLRRVVEALGKAESR